MIYRRDMWGSVYCILNIVFAFSLFILCVVILYYVVLCCYVIVIVIVIVIGRA